MIDWLDKVDVADKAVPVTGVPLIFTVTVQDPEAVKPAILVSVPAKEGCALK